MAETAERVRAGRCGGGRARGRVGAAPGAPRSGSEQGGKGGGFISPRAAPAGVREAERCWRVEHREPGQGRFAGPPGGLGGATENRPGRRHRRL